MTSYIAPVLTAAAVFLGGAAIGHADAVNLPARSPLLRVADNSSIADTSASDDLAAKRDDYMQSAKKEFSIWQDRMSDWASEAKAKGSDMSDAARANLDKAWAEIKVDWRKLQDAAPGTWDEARSAFDSASQRMKDAWQRIHAG